MCLSIYDQVLYPILYYYKSKKPYKPSDRIPIIFRLLDIFLSCLIIFYYSFVMLWFNDIKDAPFRIYNALFLMFFSLTLLINLNTGIYFKGHISLSKRKILNKYK